jgi:hypothetical protein
MPMRACALGASRLRRASDYADEFAHLVTAQSADAEPLP